MHPTVRRFRALVTPIRPILLFAGLALIGGTLAAVSSDTAARPAPIALPATSAAGVRLDTLLLGGYASGSYLQAVQILASDLSDAERAMVGSHLEKIFGGTGEEAGLGRAGRLRVAYERAVRPDGSTRWIRVLTAEAASGGRLRTAYFFEHEGAPGYYDPFGRSLDPDSWGGPLQQLRVTSAFGARRLHPILNRVLPHTGVDYAAAAGTPVRATADGIVTRAEHSGGYGNLVEIQHPSGFSTRYAHLSRIGAGLGRGRLVRQGEVLGYVGMTGLATGPHLHYELRRHGRAVDPVVAALSAGVSGDVTGDARWAGERQQLTRILARTPTLLGSRTSAN